MTALLAALTALTGLRLVLLTGFGDHRELDFVTPPNVTLPTPKAQSAPPAPLPLFDRLLDAQDDEAAN